VLLGTAALAVLGTAAAACGEPAPRPDVDALVAQLDRARADDELAAAAAISALPQVAKVLTTVAAERAAHAQALTDELTRMNGGPLVTSTTMTTTPSSQPPHAPTPKDVVAALRQSAEAAAALAAEQSGYRAGLLGSIAASCTVAHTVALGGPGS
jgi:hypothetical protein